MTEFCLSLGIKRFLLPLILLTASLVASVRAGSSEAIFLLIGQSNMAGRGAMTEADRQPVEGVEVLTRELDWKPAAHPLHFDKPSAGVGPGLEFGRLVHVAKSETVGLIPSAVGGTSLKQWTPQGPLFKNAVARTREAQKRGHLAAILWHQGEWDCGSKENAESYAERFSVMIAALRHEIGAEDVPVLVGELGEYLYDRSDASFAYARTVNAQIDSIPVRVPKSFLVQSKGLVAKNDHLHFDSASAKELGRRYAEAFLALKP